ncbi:hypothetical protein JKP88DRAFT_164996 [Tribonema minus]|uniref:Ankyrin repeat domain-containing protein n=1 Tax=Tribonema minus TaxID=303371 RepID=A0A835Z4J9_9STRA|nr:hypothetical protein JKP88DRAFT_164996 [Tribonema minus]
MDQAALAGRVEILQWLRQEQGLPFTHLTMPCAAARGRCAAVQWLHRAGCPHDVNDICEISLKYSYCMTPLLNLQQMEWLRGMGGSWSRDMVTAALAEMVGLQGAETIICWLRCEGAEWPTLGDVLLSPLEHEDFDVKALVWAAQQGCPWGEWTPTDCDGVSRRRYTIIKAIHAAGCPCQCE